MILWRKLCAERTVAAAASAHTRSMNTGLIPDVGSPRPPHQLVYPLGKRRAELLCDDTKSVGVLFFPFFVDKRILIVLISHVTERFLWAFLKLINSLMSNLFQDFGLSISEHKLPVGALHNTGCDPCVSDTAESVSEAKWTLTVFFLFLTIDSII